MPSRDLRLENEKRTAARRPSIAAKTAPDGGGVGTAAALADLAVPRPPGGYLAAPSVEARASWSTPSAAARDELARAGERCRALRGVVPSRYGWKSCKWLAEVELLREHELGFREARGYHDGADPWREDRLV